MSRWHDTFRNHAFQNTWKSINKQVKSLKAPDITVVTSVTEIARLRKVVKYVDELLQAADPELLPLNIWDNFNQQAANLLNEINNFQNNHNIGHIQNANTHIDNLLSYTRPYVASGKGAAQAAGRAFKAYADAIEEHIKLIEDRSNEAVSITENNKDRAGEILEEISAISERVEELEEQLLDGEDDKKSLQEQFNDLMEEATTWHAKIDDFHKKLTSGDEQESAIILQIEEAKEKAIENSHAIEIALTESKKWLGGLEKFYAEIFGKKGKDGKLAGGLKQELGQRSKELDEFRAKQQQAYEELIDEIESLLPGATSAGLATAYRELKESFDKPIRRSTITFYVSLLALFVTSLLVVTDHIAINPADKGWFDITIVKLGSLADYGRIILSKLPILLPVLWLALFSSKRRSEASRLREEYAHKEALAKSYQSFKKQIEKLDAKDEAMIGRLIESVIEAVAFNASSTLDKKHGDKIPMQELAEKLLEKAASVPNLGKGGG